MRIHEDRLAGLKCRFGCDDPVGIYHMPEGCWCWPDQVQALCWQHADKAQSHGAITRIVDLTTPARSVGEER
jgi:hypothetical protein